MQVFLKHTDFNDLFSTLICKLELLRNKTPAAKSPCSVFPGKQAQYGPTFDRTNLKFNLLMRHLVYGIRISCLADRKSVV